MNARKANNLPNRETPVRILLVAQFTLTDLFTLNYEQRGDQRRRQSTQSIIKEELASKILHGKKKSLKVSSCLKIIAHVFNYSNHLEGRGEEAYLRNRNISVWRWKIHLQQVLEVEPRIYDKTNRGFKYPQELYPK